MKKIENQVKYLFIPFKLSSKHLFFEINKTCWIHQKRDIE